MDFLNQALGQLRELLQSMTPAGRVTAALLIGVIIVSIGFLFQHQSAGPDEYLFNGEFLPGRVVDRAEAAIAQAKLSDYERVGNRIKVPAGQKAAYLAAVADAGALPPNFHSLMEDALNLSPFVDPETRRQKIKAATEERLSMIIGAMDGIEEAHVIYDIQKPRGLSRTNQVTATVSVDPTPGVGIDARRIKMIKKAVAGAIVGLTPDDVMIANLGDPDTNGGDGEWAALLDEPYYKARLAYEKHMKGNIENLLSYIPGIRVEVTAELDDAIEQTTHTSEPAGDPVPIVENTQNVTTERTQNGPAGRVGPYANGPSGVGDTASAKQIVDKTIDETSQIQNKSGNKDSVMRISGLVPQEVRAGIAIPQDYLIDLWREEMRRKGEDPDGPLPPGIEDEMDRISKNVIEKVQKVVSPLFPKELAEDSLSLVRVTFFEKLPAEPIPETPMSTKAMAWLSNNFSTLTMGFIALFGLLMLRSLLKSIPPSESVDSLRPATLPININDQSGDSAGSAEGSEGDDRPKLKLRKGPNLKDDLAEIVREDPDAAAAILKGWISNAG